MSMEPLLSVVVAYRNWGRERLRLSVETHLKSERRDDLEVIVSDYGSSEGMRAENFVDDLPVSIVYTETCGPWSRSSALNAGFAAARGRFYLAWDADVIAPPTFHGELLRNFDLMPHAVHLFQCRDLGARLGAESVRRHTDDMATFPQDLFDSESAWRPRWGMGMAAYSADQFDLVRGYDERFVVWGGEDRDLAARMSRMGSPLRWIESREARIYHIHHDSSREAARSSDDGRLAIDTNHHIVKEDRSIHRNLVSPTYFRARKPLVSVVIATRNRSDLLAQALESVFAQTFSDIEVIVADDGSTDNTLQLLQTIEDPRLRVLSLPHAGVAATRNRAATEARGHYLAIHDDDDLMLPQRLEWQIAAIEGNCAGSYGGWIDFDAKTGSFLEAHAGKPFSEASIAHSGRVLLHPTVMAARWACEAVPYDARFEGGSDYRWMLTLASAGLEFAHTGQVHILRRVHDASLTGRGSGQRNASRATARTLYSQTSRNKRRDFQQTGRAARPARLAQPTFVEALYQYLPESLTTQARFAKGVISTAHANELLEAASAQTSGVSVAELAPLAVSGVRAVGLWEAAFWLYGSSDRALEQRLLKGVTTQNMVGPRGPGVVDLSQLSRQVETDLTSHDSDPLATTLPLAAVEGLTPALWDYHALQDEAVVVIARSSARARAALRDLRRSIRQTFRSDTPAEIQLIRSPDGVLVCYAFKKHGDSSRWATAAEELRSNFNVETAYLCHGIAKVDASMTP